MNRRIPQTTLDYLVVAIAPTIIIALVVSLMWFLISALNLPLPGKLRWLTFFFSLAAVLITRIAIDLGAPLASGYAFALGGALMAVMFMFLPLPAFLIACGLVASAWWCIHQLTWDTTVVDESQRANTSGILETIGLDQPTDLDRQPPAKTATDATTGKDAVEATSWWERWRQRQKRLHVPGKWVVYFAVAAVPLFGLGQFLGQHSAPEQAQFRFLMLLIYIASCLGLLMATSLLQLRKYLRQRQIAMPAQMAGNWLIGGTIMVVVLLLVCQVLPRPAAEYGVVESLTTWVQLKQQQASRWGWGDEGVTDASPGTAGKAIPDQQPVAPQGPPGPSSTDDQARSAGDSPVDPEAPRDGSGQAVHSTATEPADGQGGTQQADAPPAESGQPPAEAARRADDSDARDSDSGDSDSGDSDSGDSDSGDSDAGDSDAEGQARDRQANGASSRSGNSAATAAPRPQDSADTEAAPRNTQPASPSSSSPRSPGWQMPQLPLSGIVRLLYWLVLLVGVVWIAWLLRGYLGDWWGSLSRRQPSEPDTDDAPQPVQPSTAFRDFANPFARGHHMSPDELVRYTFEAVEAWAYEQGRGRRAEQTPAEFARGLTQRNHPLHASLSRLADLYNRAAYAAAPLSQEAVQPLAQLWHQLHGGISAT